MVPDLRGSPFIAVDAWYSIVLDGALKEGGMAPFGSVLDRAKATAIRDYIIHRANEANPTRRQDAHTRPIPTKERVIVAQGTAAGAPACAQCHAFTGGSDGSGAFPRIAGQSAFYLSRQLRDFSSGVRSNAIMSPIASALSAGRYRRRGGLLRKRRSPIPAAGETQIRISSSGARNSPRRAIRRKEFPAAATATARAAPASRRQSHISPDNTRITPLSSCRCGSAASAGTAPTAMALFAKMLDDQEIAAVAAYYQQLGRSSAPRRRSKE